MVDSCFLFPFSQDDASIGNLCIGLFQGEISMKFDVIVSSMYINSLFGLLYQKRYKYSSKLARNKLLSKLFQENIL